MYFAVSASGSILSSVSWVIRLLCICREQEHVTGASHTPGNQLKGRALDFFYRIGPLVCRTVHKHNHSFFLLSGVGRSGVSFGADVWQNKNSSDKLQVWTIDMSFITNSMKGSEGDRISLLFCLKLTVILTSCILLCDFPGLWDICNSEFKEGFHIKCAIFFLQFLSILLSHIFLQK